MVKSKDQGDQPSVASFFNPTPTQSKKRSLETIIILSSDDDNEDKAPSTQKIVKRIKSEPTANQPLASTSKVVSKAAEKVAQFKFNPDASTSTLPPPPRTEEQIARRAEFVKKLGGTNFNRQLYLQKNHYLDNNEEVEEGREGRGEEEEEEESEGEEEQEESSGKGKGKAVAKGKGKEKEEAAVSSRFAKFAAKGSASSSTVKGKGKEQVIKYTPLELQVIELKRQNPGVLLMVEVGYKMRFFGEDALVASRVLGIAQFPSHHMNTASIPVHRLNVHLKRLINEGYKVGVVRQIETAALKKVSDNKNTPFTRELTSLTTSATFIDDDLSGNSESTSSSSGTLLCLVEETKVKDDGKVRIGLIAVIPSTGEVIYDEFEDGFTRSELETRILHLQPSELILPELSKPTESLINYHIGQHSGVESMTCRTEKIKKKLTKEQAFTFVSEFYTKAKREKAGDIIVIDDEDEEMIDEDPALNQILSLPSSILIALSALITYLKSFSLSSLFLQTSHFSHFSSRSTMTLNANSMANLEVLRNQTDFKEGKGSLLHVVDRCKTTFGRRLLRKWVRRPLVLVNEVNDRLDAVTEINSASGSLPIVTLRKLLSSHLPDLERGLVRIYYQKVSTSQEILKILQAFKSVGEVFESSNNDDDDESEEERDVGVESKLLQDAIKSLPRIKEKVAEWLGELHVDKAREGKMEEMFKESEKLERLQDAKDSLASIEWEMTELLESVRKFLKKPKLEFISVAQEEFLLPLTIVESKKLAIPDNWLKVNSTKTYYRWRSPEIQKKMQEINQAREHLTNEAKLAFKNYLISISTSYELLRASINSVALVDCLFSLASLAQAPGYCRPVIVREEGRLEIVDGRHPIVEVLLDAPYVPNSVSIGGDSTRQQILTGVNMNGKSTLARSVALIALLAQIGSYCPATSVTTSLFDGIYTRMGASDDLARGRSTFMVEMSETSEILKLATPRSLIILDEIGRGTSTHDGLAIASAVLQHIVTMKSLCLFVTHYPSLAELVNRYPDSLSVHHMACLEETKPGTDFAQVTFLYKLKEGLASKSHGLNVARLSKLPDSVLRKAAEKSKEMEEKIKLRTLKQRAIRMTTLIKALTTDELNPESVIELAYNFLHAGGE